MNSNVVRGESSTNQISRLLRYSCVHMFMNAFFICVYVHGFHSVKMGSLVKLCLGFVDIECEMTHLCREGEGYSQTLRSRGQDRTGLLWVTLWILLSVSPCLSLHFEKKTASTGYLMIWYFEILFYAYENVQSHTYTHQRDEDFQAPHPINNLHVE